MRITITISEELASEAQSRGLNPEAYVEDLLAKRSTPPFALSQIREERIANLDQFLNAMAISAERIPDLPDYAFTRESFYSDDRD